MKALLVLALMLIVAASALAFGGEDISRGVSGFSMTEPAYMLLSGTALIAIAGAVRRISL